MKVTEQKSRFEDWLQSHRGIVVKITRSFTNTPADFDDLFQEVLLQIWKSIPAFRDHAKASTWIYRVALNRALLWQRHESKYRNASQSLGRFEAIDTSSPDSSSERIESLYRAIRCLKKADRALILLALEGLSYREISRISDLSESNVGVRLTRIKKQLHHHLIHP